MIVVQALEGDHAMFAEAIVLAAQLLALLARERGGEISLRAVGGGEQRALFAVDDRAGSILLGDHLCQRLEHRPVEAEFREVEKQRVARIAIGPGQQFAPERQFVASGDQRGAEEGIGVGPAGEVRDRPAIIAFLVCERQQPDQFITAFEQDDTHGLVGIERAQGGQEIPGFDERIGLARDAGKFIPARDDARRPATRPIEDAHRKVRRRTSGRHTGRCHGRCRSSPRGCFWFRERDARQVVNLRSPRQLCHQTGLNRAMRTNS
jgi:hypothetical protein